MKEPRQIPLDLGTTPSFDESDFLVAPCNRSAFELIARWPAWSSATVAIVGPPGSGKTHLARLWAVRSGASVISGAALGSAANLPALAAGGACVVEDAETVVGSSEAERALFHLHNLLTGAGGYLLLTASDAPARWPIALPDLASRLKAAPLATIGQPDEETLAAVLVKLFADRQVVVPAEALTYLVARMERSFEAAVMTVERIDRAALARQAAVTLPLIRSVLMQEDES